MIKQCLIVCGICLVANASLAADTETEQTSRRIFMLETALAPANPQAVVSAWANAAKNRNGAVQYMLMCPDLQKAHIADLNTLNWVTGISSPSISSTKIMSQSLTQKQATWKFAIQYKFSAGGKSVGSTVDHIDVVRVNGETNSSQQFCISQFGSLSPVDKL